MSRDNPEKNETPEPAPAALRDVTSPPGAPLIGHDKPGPLVAWLRTVLLGAVLVPLIAFIGIAWWGLREAQNDAEATAQRASAAAHEHTRRALTVAHNIALITAQLTDLPDAEIREQEAALRQRLADMLAGLPSIVNMNVWDGDGRPLVRSDQMSDTQSSVADRAYFQQQRDAAFGVGMSEVLTGRQTGKELMNLTIRRPSADGSFRGVVAVSLSPGYFRDYFRAVSDDDKRLASFALLRSDGEILARWPPAPDGRTRVPKGRETLTRMERGEVSGTHVIPADAGRATRVVSFRKVMDYPVYVVAGFDRAEMLADWIRFLALLAAVIVPISAVLVYVTLVALRKTHLERQMAHDLGEQVRLRASAERSMLETQRLETLSALTGGVAHDFNNLLAIIDTSLHVHRRKHPEMQSDAQITAMARAVRSGVRLTRQLLSFSRKQALKPELVRLQTWLPSAEELLRATLGSRIKLELSVQPLTSAIHVDTGELELALINLAMNARHAMADGGTFVIYAHDVSLYTGGEQQPQVVISVSDTGVGIPPEILPRVVEPFFTTRKRGTGSGLGLSQVHTFCSQAGGQMKVESRLGAGTTVTLSFPASAEGHATLASAASVAPGLRLEGTALLVEDNEELATSIESLLGSAGLNVIWVRSGDAALARLDAMSRQPDVVLSDIEMPGKLSGIDLAFRLKQLHPDLPVLLTTGYADQIERAIAGGFEVLPKPTHPESLLKRLSDLLKNRQRA